MKEKFRHIICAVINDISGDQRVHRIASTLVEAGYRVTVVGRKLPDSTPLSDRPYTCVRLNLPVYRGKLFYALFQLRLFLWMLTHKADILLANDLDTLLPSFLSARLQGRRLIYDSHEYYTEVPELVDRPRTRSIWLWVERRLFPRLRTVYTVNESLARIYGETYKVPVQIIRNVPWPYQPDLGIEKPKILIYQGALNMGRGIELMIKTLHHLPDYHLWIIGRGDIDEELRLMVKAEGLSGRIIFKGFVPLEGLRQLTVQARLGLSLEEDLGLNYHYASPNKVYDYIQARLPVIVSDLPEMARLVDTYEVGAVLPRGKRYPAELAQLVRKFEIPSYYRARREACEKAAKELNWEQEKARLVAIFAEQ
ncbi:MAG: glycosyltransferase [Bacteroidota bacterium]